MLIEHRRLETYYNTWRLFYYLIMSTKETSERASELIFTEIISVEA